MKTIVALAAIAFLLYLSRRKPEIMQFDDDIDWLAEDVYTRTLYERRMAA